MEQIHWKSIVENMLVLEYDAVIVGTGCAGYQAADSLFNLGVKNIVIVSEGINSGTSRNTGSDKQTYYKLSLGGAETDSVRALAEDLFAGGGVNGDIAMTEACYSPRCFFRLLELGVPFPSNDYGEYIGYYTDHDKHTRATSCGPLTSKYMTEALERSCTEKNIPVLNHLQVVSLLVEDQKIYGLIAIHNRDGSLVGVLASYVVLATGGPAGVYAQSVYPKSQKGMTGMALSAGALGVNLQEWQYGLASIAFRWNVSGSYQQALPRYVSLDADGTEHEFLSDVVGDPERVLQWTFQKGHEWPVDFEKLEQTSQIDLLVHYEITQKKRRVFLDYRNNPRGLHADLSNLPQEIKTHYTACDAMRFLPVERLEAINPEALLLYQRHGIDLRHEMLEIAVCAQHCNGGLDVDANWQTNIKGLYAAGEVAGTFGVYRPGGAALNSTQVGALRAAEHIAALGQQAVPKSMAMSILKAQAFRLLHLLQDGKPVAKETLYRIRRELQEEMSRFAAFPRDTAKWDAMIQTRELFLQRPMKTSKTPALWSYVLQTRDIVQTQLAMLSAMKQATVFGSRGSAILVRDGKLLPREENLQNLQMITRLFDDHAKSDTRPVRTMPNTQEAFEVMWKKFRQKKSITWR